MQYEVIDEVMKFVDRSVVQFSEMFCRYDRLSPEIQSVVKDNAAIISSDMATDDERSRAIDVLLEALFSDAAPSPAEPESSQQR